MDLSHLISLSRRYSVETPENPASLPRLSVYRRDAPGPLEAMIYEPVICLILQGGKTTSVGDHHVHLLPGDALLVSHDTPVMSRITTASVGAPYTALILSLDLGLARGLYGQIADARPPLPAGRSCQSGPLSMAQTDPAWLSPLVRYFELMDDAMDARVLGPSTLSEVHYRLLLSPIGQALRRLLATDSHASKIARAIGKLRADYNTPLSVATLARTAGMSVSSFHEHFKTVTRTTPLQYQKDLRLIAAHTMLADGGHSVSDAAFSVGYESPTHFSRDYGRKFGHPPSRDIGAAVATSARRGRQSVPGCRPSPERATHRAPG